MYFRKGVDDDLEADFVLMIEHAESYAGFQFEITSAFRVDDGSHGEGRAVDIGCLTSKRRWSIVMALTDAGFVRIGVYDRHIHADRSKKAAEYVLWTGVSK